ncbi:MAG: N-6 DNA methylase [Spirochaetales bacterium]|nr:N-6 DNA methylase [Spirochaetales bacterium]
MEKKQKYCYIFVMEQTSYAKKDIQKKFNISLATVNNWIKTGVIPSPENGFYTKESYLKLIKSIESDSIRLQARANRSFSDTSDIVFLGITNRQRKELLIKLVEKFKTSSLSVLEAIACLGKQILISNNLYNEKSEIYSELNKIHVKENIFADFIIENEDDDILGAFYQSVQTIATKSKNGSFFTPSKLLVSIKIPENAKVLDPCCGSGGILIRTLSKKHEPSKIYAYDIDETALLICKINFILFFDNAFISPHIEKHDLIFCEKNTLFSEDSDKNNRSETFDFIVTNPPWGSKLSEEQKEFLLRTYPLLGTTEVFSIALFNALEKLNENGILNFFLPESVLNVGTHKNIRKFLLKSKRNIEIIPFGTAFKGVQSECILLKLSAKTDNDVKIVVKKDSDVILNKKNITAPDYLISYNVSDFDNEIIEKIYSAKSVKLSENTKFALGIVTGNNKKYIRETKSAEDEAVFRGKDILPYKLKKPENFIKFTPEIFQQVAPVEMYRSKKIVYKFISDKIVCALDDGSLVLNSANIIISDDYPMEILVCLFNSPIYSFIYQKKFKSKKVLKQHFQDFPLPVLDQKTEKMFLSFYSDILKGTINQTIIDRKICECFGISDKQYNHIKESVYGIA